MPREGAADPRVGRSRSPPPILPGGAAGGERLQPPAVMRRQELDREARQAGAGRIKRKGGRHVLVTLDDGQVVDATALEESRREIIREFRKELKPALPTTRQSRFVKWHFPHHGEAGKSCGSKVFFAHDNPSGPSHFWAFEAPCRNRSCPTCGPVYERGECIKAGAWETRIAGQWQNEIRYWLHSDEAEALAFETKQRKLPIAHIVVSVHPKDWDHLVDAEKTRETLNAVREASHRYARRAGLVGAYWALHGKRVPSKWNARACAIDGLHFHYVGVTRHRYGRVDGDYVKRLHARKKWVVKRIGLQDSFFGTALYQLSHATWAEYHDGEDPDDDQGVVVPPLGAPPLPGYPALVHNSETGRSCGRIGAFLGLGGQAPPVVLPEDMCGVCGHEIPVSMRYEVWKLADAPPPGAAGWLDWAHWADCRPEPGAAAIAESVAATAARKAAALEAASRRCSCNGGPAPKEGCCKWERTTF